MTLTPIFKLLSDETRLRVMVILKETPMCVCELVGVLEVPQPKISKILSKLRDMDLVEDTRVEKFVFYRLKADNALLNHVLAYIDENIHHYSRLETDRQRLSKKEAYLDACSLASLKTLVR